MTKIKRNKKTGILEVWENGKKIGEIHTIGDDVKKGGDNNERANNKKQHQTS